MFGKSRLIRDLCHWETELKFQVHSFKQHLLDTHLTFTALRLARRFVGDWLYKEEYYYAVAPKRIFLDVLQLLNTVILSPIEIW